MKKIFGRKKRISDIIDRLYSFSRSKEINPGIDEIDLNHINVSINDKIFRKSFDIKYQYYADTLNSPLAFAELSIRFDLTDKECPYFKGVFFKFRNLSYKVYDDHSYSWLLLNNFDFMKTPFCGEKLTDNMIFIFTEFIKIITSERFKDNLYDIFKTTNYSGYMMHVMLNDNFTTWAYFYTKAAEYIIRDFPHYFYLDKIEKNVLKIKRDLYYKSYPEENFVLRYKNNTSYWK